MYYFARMLILPAALCIFPLTWASAGPYILDEEDDEIFHDSFEAIEAIPINSIEELQMIGSDDEYPVDEDYMLVDDIDASETADWNGGAGFEPIGTESDPFSGTLYADNRTITDITIARPDEENVGIFGYAENASFQNVSVENADVTGYEKVGGLIGRGESIEIDGFSIAGSITGVGESGFISVGGVIGWKENDDSVLKNGSADVTVAGDDSVGGLVGNMLGGTLENATVEGAVQQIGDDAGSRFGGAVGRQDVNFDNLVRNVVSSTELSAPDAASIGGLVGEARGVIEDSSASADVEGRFDVGGLVGDFSGEDDGIYLSYASGDVTGTQQRIGGLLGQLQSGVVEESHATGHVANIGTSGDTDVGGLIGSTGNNSTVRKSYAEGDVTSLGDEDQGGGSGGVGGLIGSSRSSIKDCHATGDVTASPQDFYDLVYLGGLVGEAWPDIALDETPVTRSYATGNVIALSEENTATREHLGGLIGHLGTDMVIEESFAASNVTAQTTEEVLMGGLVGSATEDSSAIINSHATGSLAQINVAEDAFVGGLVGESEIGIENSFAAVEVTAADGAASGGFSGSDSSSMEGSYWDVPASTEEEATGPGPVSGVDGLGNIDDPAPADEMTGEDAIENMSALDFDTIWETTDGYPTLQNID